MKSFGAVCALVLVSSIGCGDDDGASGGGSATSSASGSSTNAASATNSATSASSSSTSTSGSGGGMCAHPDVLAPLSQFIGALDGSAELLAGHASSNEAVGFFQAPGLPSPPALTASFAGLFMPCSMPVLFEPFCEEGRCSRLECPNSSTEWINHLYLQNPPTTLGSFTFENLTLDLRWPEGSNEVELELDVVSSGPADRDWTMAASGVLGADTWSIEATFPALIPGGTTTLTAGVMADLDATLAVGAIVVAEGVPLVATGACP